MVSSISPKKRAGRDAQNSKVIKSKIAKSPIKRKNLEKVIRSLSKSSTTEPPQIIGKKEASKPKIMSTKSSPVKRKTAKKTKKKADEKSAKFMEKFLATARKRPKPQSKASAKLKPAASMEKDELMEANNNIEDNLNNNVNKIVLDHSDTLSDGDEASNVDVPDIAGMDLGDLEDIIEQSDDEIDPEVIPYDKTHKPRLSYSPNVVSDEKGRSLQRKMFQCKVCEQLFPNRYFHRKHMLSEHEDQLYECRVCSFNSVHPEKLKNHIIKLHVAKKEKAEQINADELQQELENLIEKKIPRKVIMEDGVSLGRDGTNKLRFVCALCSRRYSSKYALERHVRCHTLEKPYHCDVCDFTSSYKEHMKRHITSVHLIVHSNEPKMKYIPKKKISEEETALLSANEETGECEENEGDGKKRRNILRKRFECAVCGLKATHKVDLMEHIKDKHPNAHIESLNNNDGSKVHLIVTVAKKPRAPKKLTIQCTYCSLIFHDTWKYKVHLRSHTGVKPFRCSECFFRATSKMTVRDHIHRKHNSVAKTAKIFLRTVGIDGEVEEVPLAVPWREFKCEFCGVLLKDNYNLKQHKQKEHADALPFSCSLCDFKALTKASMIKHCLESHEDENLSEIILHYGKPAKIATNKLPSCEFCNRIFAYQSQLNIHLKNHTGEKTFQCDHCEYKTNSKTLVTNHLMKKHFGPKGKNKRKNNNPKKVGRKDVATKKERSSKRGQ